MIKTLILVPIQDNEGQPFEPQAWTELEHKLLQFGGFTDGGLVQGAWTDNGQTYRDTNRRWEVALTSWTQLPVWLEVAQWTRTRFRQVAIYIEIAGIPEIIG